MSLYQRFINTREGSKYSRNKSSAVIRAVCEFILKAGTQYELSLKYGVSPKSIIRHHSNVLVIVENENLLRSEEKRRARIPTRRSKFEIHLGTLDTISKEDKPTRIMYKANLSWSSLQRSLAVLLKNGLIRMTIVGKSRRYYITPRGENRLHSLKPQVEELR